MNTIDDYYDENGSKLRFTLEPISFSFEGVAISFNEMPYLINESTKEWYLPQACRVVTEMVVGGAKSYGKDEVTITPPKELLERRFSYCTDLPFSYSALEYYFIPGLAREFNEGFLTPVYFSIEVLNKYNQHPEYELSLMSSTYGSLRYKDEWHISFGVNRNKSVIMWLGDIHGLPTKEQYYLLSENIPPEFDVHSEFYEGQICVQWAQGALESKVFKLRENLSSLVEQKFGNKLFKLDGEISKVLADLQKPVFWEDKHVAPVIEALNRVFVESLCEKSIKDILANHPSKPSTKGLRGLKLFTKLLSDVFEIENSDELMCPFFVLYDYRIIMCHLQSENTVSERMKTIHERLKVASESKEHEAIYMALFESMQNSLESICSKLEG